jgi:hypothetical protein
MSGRHPPGSTLMAPNFRKPLARCACTDRKTPGKSFAFRYLPVRTGAFRFFHPVFGEANGEFASRHLPASDIAKPAALTQW